MATEAQKIQQTVNPKGKSYHVHTQFLAPGQTPIPKEAILHECYDGFYNVMRYGCTEPMFIRLGPLVIADCKNKLTLINGQSIDTT
jgi:hypothetical protein